MARERKKPWYVVVKKTYFDTKKLAEEAVAEDGGEIYVLHPYGPRCPHGNDHAHAEHDGATYCSGCDRYLTLRIEKKL